VVIVVGVAVNVDIVGVGVGVGVGVTGGGGVVVPETEILTHVRRPPRLLYAIMLYLIED